MNNINLISGEIWIIVVAFSAIALTLCWVVRYLIEKYINHRKIKQCSSDQATS